MTVGGVTAGWALWSKAAGSREDYRIVRTSVTEQERQELSETIAALLPGAPHRVALEPRLSAGLPWVTFGVEPSPEGSPVAGVCVTSQAAERDNAGRTMAQSLYFRLPFDVLARQAAGFTAQWRTVRSLALPEDDAPLTVCLAPQPWDEIAADVEDSGLFEWCAVTAATLLERPVAIVAARPPGPDEAALVLDAVAGLLPYGFRHVLSAGTGADGMTHHVLRLAFAPHARHDAAEARYDARQDPDAYREAESGLGEIGRAYLRELRALREHVGGTVRRLIAALAEIAEPYRFGPGEDGSARAVAELRKRDPVGAVLRDIADAPVWGTPLVGPVPLGDAAGDPSPDPSLQRLLEEAGRLLTARAIPEDRLPPVWKFLARNAALDRLTADAWERALPSVAEVVQEALAAPSSPAGCSGAFGQELAERSLDAAPAALRDRLLGLILDVRFSETFAQDHAAFASGLAHVAWSQIARADPRRLTATRAALLARPQLAFLLVDQALNDPSKLARVVDLFGEASPVPPWLGTLRRLLDGAPPAAWPDALDVVDADSPGLGELLFAVAVALGHVDLGPFLWPALLRMADRDGRRAPVIGRRVAAVRAAHPEAFTPDFDAYADVLALLAGQRALSVRPTSTGLDEAYLSALAAAWREPFGPAVRRRIVLGLVEWLLSGAAGPARSTMPDPGAVPLALGEVLGVSGPDLPAEVAEVLVQARQAGAVAIDAIPEPFWSGLGDRHRSLTDPHWKSALREAGRSGKLPPVLSVWPRVVAGGIDGAQEALEALGPWPPLSPARRALIRLPGGRGLLRTWCAEVERLIGSVEPPPGADRPDADRYRAELRAAVIRGVWGRRRGSAFHDFHSRTDPQGDGVD